MFSNILFIVLWCLFSWWFLFVGYLIGQVRMWTRGIFEISFMVIWLDVMMNFMIWIEIYVLWALCYWTFMRTWVLRTNVIFVLLVKELNLINITFVVWDTIVVCDFWEGSLGACLWEWLEMGFRAQSGYQGSLFLIVW